jgi:hypothetical protein
MFYLRWVALAVLLAGLTYVIVTADCWKRGELLEPEPESIVLLNWADTGDLPPIGVRTGMITVGSSEAHQPNGTASARETIDGAEYLGIRRYQGEGAEEEKPGALQIEAFARRVRAPVEIIDIRVRSKLTWGLQIESFQGGIVRRADSKEEIRRPYRFEPGEYHLEALMPEKPDGQ